MTAPLDIKKLREIAEAATPGRWMQDGSGVVADFDGEMLYVSQSFGKNADEDIEFNATFNPETVLRLLDTIERYEAALKFYATEENWYLHKDPVTGSEVRRSIVYEDTESYSFQKDPYSPNILQVFAGKTAREALRADAEENKP